MQVIERHKIGSIGAGLIVLVALATVVMWIAFPSYRNLMYKPNAGDRKVALATLQDIIGDDAKTIAVPAVNKDINLIYVTASLSVPSIENVKAQGRPIRDMPGEVFEFVKPNHTVLIDLKSKPTKIMVGADETENAQRCVLRYREWLEGKKLPWP